MIDPSKVLPITLEQYYLSKCVPGSTETLNIFLYKYELVGVHYEGFTDGEWGVAHFCREAPDNAVAIVEYQCIIAGAGRYKIHPIKHTGVALVPKD